MTRLQLEGGHPARSLVWDEERLVDLASGGRSVSMDGTVSPSGASVAYPFDRALLGPTRSIAVLYAVAATKGIVIDRSAGIRLVRELDRSYYFAQAYEYPIAVGASADGTPLLIHCPDGYNRLAIERLDDGARLSVAGQSSTDVFHSRLALSPGGRYLLSAGWLWHPVGDVRVYDVAEALDDSRHLERRGVLPLGSIDTDAEVACWLDDDRLLVGTNPVGERFDADRTGLGPGELGVWSMARAGWDSRVPIDTHLGPVHRFGPWILALFDHPRVIDPGTGMVVAEWPEIRTGEQIGSLLPADGSAVPLIAVDSDRRRFAVSEGDEIVVLQLSQ